MRVSSDALRRECPALASGGVMKPAAGYRNLSLISLSSSFTPKGRGHCFATSIEPGVRKTDAIFAFFKTEAVASRGFSLVSAIAIRAGSLDGRP